MYLILHERVVTDGAVVNIDRAVRHRNSGQQKREQRDKL